jgi:hypothetical protein
MMQLERQGRVFVAGVLLSAIVCFVLWVVDRF